MKYEDNTLWGGSKEGDQAEEDVYDTFKKSLWTVQCSLLDRVGVRRFRSGGLVIAGVGGSRHRFKHSSNNSIQYFVYSHTVTNSQKVITSNLVTT